MHICTREGGQGKIRLTDDRPLNAADATRGWVSELVEGVGREVEISVGAALTPVGQGDEYGLAFEGNPGSLATHGVVVRVYAIVTRETIEERMGNSGDILSVIIDNTTSAKTGSIEGPLAAVDSSSPAVVVITVVVVAAGSGRGRGGSSRSIHGGGRGCSGWVRGWLVRSRLRLFRSGSAWRRRLWVVPLVTKGRWRGLRLSGSGRGKAAAGVCGTAATTSTPAKAPLGGGRNITSINFSDWSNIWLGNAGGDLPVVVSLTSEMRWHSCHGDCSSEQNCELNQFEHAEIREREGKKESEKERGR